MIAQEAPLMGDGEAAWAHATHWYYEPDTFKPIAKQTADGALFYIVTDHLGTAREMFSEDGHLVWGAHYRTWGAVKHIWQADNDNEAYHTPNPSPAFLMRGSLAIRYDRVAEQRAHEAALNCPIRFQGQWEDAESGLYYNHHRYYDPLVGQYMSPDSLGIAGGMRPNGYVHNPNTHIDPLGLAETVPLADIRYSQDSISQRFRNGTTIYGLRDALKSNPGFAYKIPPIEIYKYKGDWYSHDNRRLWAYKQAGVQPNYRIVEYDSKIHGNHLTTKTRDVV